MAVQTVAILGYCKEVWTLIFILDRHLIKFTLPRCIIVIKKMRKHRGLAIPPQWHVLILKPRWLFTTTLTLHICTHNLHEVEQCLAPTKEVNFSTNFWNILKPWILTIPFTVAVANDILVSGHILLNGILSTDCYLDKKRDLQNISDVHIFALIKWPSPMATHLGDMVAIVSRG